MYSSPKSTEEDILISVPVPAKLYDQLRQAAMTAKVSESAWAVGAIKARLAAH
ncbi:hypothetical protein [Lichenihabitans psoromatis]|uniref:hypothetical protein n=1 Tax=Lichenihabitans psoromatis TaxID=2528642 RepID=UPI0013F16B96|nr:hypothetical protein [Lichenihabitans psoromatis]